jgi:phosphonate transport system substrate-binding protein
MSRNRIIFFVLFIIAIFTGVYFLIDLFGQHALNRLYSPTKRISLEKGYKGNIQKTIFVNDPHAPEIRIAIAPIMSPEKSLPIYKDLINYMGKVLNRQPVLMQKSSYSEVNDLLHYDGCDVGFVCTYPYVLGERDYGLKLLVIPRIQGNITARSFIIVPAESKAQSLLDLRGKRFASCDIISQTGWIYPAIWLLKHGENPKEFFGEHIICGSHDRAVGAVATQFADGAAVQNLVYEKMVADDPSLADKVRIVMKSQEYGMPPIVANPRMDPVLLETLRKALLSMHESAEGRAILNRMGIERYEVPESSLYDNSRVDAELWNPRS